MLRIGWLLLYQRFDAVWTIFLIYFAKLASLDIGNWFICAITSKLYYIQVTLFEKKKKNISRTTLFFALLMAFLLHIQFIVEVLIEIMLHYFQIHSRALIGQESLKPILSFFFSSLPPPQFWSFEKIIYIYIYMIYQTFNLFDDDAFLFLRQKAVCYEPVVLFYVINASFLRRTSCNIGNLY